MRLSAAPQVPVPDPNASPRAFALLAAFTYLALVLLMWLPFNPCGGMPYESQFLFNSEVWPIKGFLYPSDPLRPHTSTFYHVSFLLGEVLRIGGSFVPFQLVYAALWWARGLLLFLILRRLFPAEGIFAFCCGALAIVHASDHTLLWVGQLNQLGFIFWMLLAFYLFVLAIQSGSETRTRWSMVGAAVAQHMSLWSYESQLLLILCAPLALLACDRRRLLAKPRIAAAWYVLPAAYLFLSAYGYLIRAAGAYQEGVLRTDWSLPAVAQDLWFNLSASLAFWSWTENIPWTLAPEWPARFGMAAAAVYLLGWAGAALLRNARAGVSPGAKNEGEPSGASSVPPTLTPTAWLAMLLASFAVLLMSFPAYLLLASAASLWRTQLLSGIGTALVWASLAGLAASLLPRRWPRAWVFLALGAVVANFGVASALRAGLSHDQVWSRQRQAFETMLKIAPRLPERTVVVAVNVPRASDPFGHNMWFNYGLKLVYPGSRIGGVYFYDDGAPAEGNHLHLESADWVWDGSFEWPGYERQDASHTVVIDFDSLTNAQIDPLLPAILSPQQQALDRYKPLAVVGPGPPSPRAVRRYYPCPDWWWTLSPKPK